MANALKIIPLGGLGEIGLNMMAYEYGDSIIVVDSGLMFPEEYMLGIDVVIPDVSYLAANKDKVKGFVITHGHEDHIGALPFVLPKINVPIYATAMTIGLIETKLEEYDLLKTTTFETMRPRDRVVLGDFSVEFIRVSHSIVDGCALAITTPAGVVIHTGDFKFDQTPVDGEVTDYARFSEYGEKGVDLLLSDSTNVESEGYTISESTIGKAFDEIFSRAKGRIIVAAFSSHIHRIQQVINATAKQNRKLVLNGKSMVGNVAIARTLGYLNVPDDLIVDIKTIDALEPNQAVLLTTGSQGEPMSALLRMAMDAHKQLRIINGDTVILSSKFIPGHEKAISNMMNHLFKRGAEVIFEKVSDVHVSGHAAKEELLIMLNLVKPRCFIPLHGEYRHLVKHGRLAESVGVEKENIVIAEDGDVVELTKDSIKKAGRVESGRVFVDGKGVGDIGDIVLRDRKHLSQDGMVVAIIAINQASGETIYGPEIFTRGLVFEEESSEILSMARLHVVETLSNTGAEEKGDLKEVEEIVRVALRRFFKKTLERRPVILPVIIEV
ncbi:MAG: ribonuclease J [Deltaproteobacteria bacterium]|nr:ribonuclease J [Deltaproteobacteria bacterium]